MRRRTLIVAIVCAAIAGAVVALLTAPEADAQARTSTVARGLDVPWELAFLPDGRALLTERGGRVLLFSRGLRSRRSAGRLQAASGGEGGLLGLAPDPGFARNRLVYAYRTVASENQVIRLRLRGSRLVYQRAIVRDLRAAGIHNGGRIKFGPDGALYIATGDYGTPSSAQDPRALNGKILRLPVAAARGNAVVRPEIVSSGHRNVQGLSWQPGTNRLVATELGQEDRDEVNVIREGANFGWPAARGGDTGGGRFTAAAWDTGDDNVAPSGGTFVTATNAWRGSFVFGALVGEQVRRLTFSGDRVVRDQRLFRGRFGRIRTVVEGPDGRLYLLTSNRDGRGNPTRSDDRIIRVTPPR